MKRETDNQKNVVPFTTTRLPGFIPPKEGVVISLLTEDQIWNYGHEVLEELTTLNGEVWELTKQQTTDLAGFERDPVTETKEPKKSIWQTDLLARVRRGIQKKQDASKQKKGDRSLSVDFNSGPDRLRKARKGAQTRLEDLRQCQELLSEITPQLEGVVSRFKQENVPESLRMAYEERRTGLHAAAVTAGQLQRVLEEACRSEMATLRWINAEEAALRAQVTADTAKALAARTKQEAGGAPNSPAPGKPPSYRIGRLVKGKGVYVGEWKPKDRGGRDLGKVFDVYAAPEDVVDKRGKKLFLTFNKAVRGVAGLRDWHGHDGARFENDTAIYNAIRDGRYEELEKWFIPTLDLVNGYDKNTDKVNRNNLYEHKYRGAFRGRFTDRRRSDLARWYWSCTEYRDGPYLVHAVDFTDGVSVWILKDTCKLSTRPVRAELRATYDPEVPLPEAA